MKNQTFHTANIFGSPFWLTNMNVFCDTQTGLEILYRNRTLDDVLFDKDIADEYNSVSDELELNDIVSEPNWSLDFNLPEYYRSLDVETYIKNLVQQESPEKLARVEKELDLYKAKNLYDMLRLMIYIVESMRRNNIVWGVGRGSSVASYCLYLIGVHKIDSVKYNLDIEEFLR